MSINLGSSGADSARQAAQSQSQSQAASLQSGQQFASSFMQAMSETEKYTRTVANMEESQEQEALKRAKEDDGVADTGATDEEDAEFGGSIHNAIATMQSHLLRLRNNDQTDLADQLSDMAQEQIDALKEDGYKLDDIES